MGIGVSLYRNMTVNNSIGFLGEYEVSIDAKNRFLVPAGFRKQLPEGAEDRFVINRGFETCLTVYTIESWSKLSEQINKLNDFNPKVREFKRLFLNGATIVELDAAGRILLPKSLCEHAGIDKEIVLSAFGSKIEIWSKDKYKEMISNEPDDISDLGEKVMGKINKSGEEGGVS